MQTRKSAGKRSTLDLKPVRKDTQSPKQEQSLAPQNGPLSNKKKFKKKKKSSEMISVKILVMFNGLWFKELFSIFQPF